MSGIEFYEHIQAEYPPLAKRVIIITGDVMAAGTTDFITKNKLSFVSKPFVTESLKNSINRVWADSAQNE